MMTNRARSQLFAIASAGILMLGACGGPPAPVVDLSWPLPPAEPMITYERSIYGSPSLQRSFLTRLNDFIFGESPDELLAKPYGIVCNDTKLYVVDTARKGVMVLDLSAGGVRFFNSLGPYGRLAEPVGLALDDSGRIHVADTKLGRIAIFDDEGRFVRFLGAEGDLVSPVGMGFGPDGDRLYVVDTQLHMVRIFDRAGDLVGSFGQRGDQQGEFYYPLGIAVGPGGIVYVVDSFHFAVQAFDLEGEFLFSFGSSPRGIGSLARPRAIALDPDGHLYVTDALNNNVQVFDRAGGPILGFGSYGLAEAQFRLPAGICINSGGMIYVADSINRRIQEFRYLPPAGEEAVS